MSPFQTSMPACPRCHSARHLIPILYGLPSPATEALVEGGWCLMGGPEIAPNAPWWACQFCYARFREAVTPSITAVPVRKDHHGVAKRRNAFRTRLGYRVRHGHGASIRARQRSAATCRRGNP